MLDWCYWYFTLVLIIDICNIHNVYCNHSTCICNLSIVSSQSASMCRQIGHGIKELLLCTMHALHSQSTAVLNVTYYSRLLEREIRSFIVNPFNPFDAIFAQKVTRFIEVPYLKLHYTRFGTADKYREVACSIVSTKAACMKFPTHETRDYETTYYKVYTVRNEDCRIRQLTHQDFTHRHT